jgi:hypothetical protein
MDELYELRKLDEPLDDVLDQEERELVARSVAAISKPVPAPPGWTSPGDGYVFGSLSSCRSSECGRSIAWFRTPAGKTAPYDATGISHFATCVAAERFRRPKRSDTRKEGS